MWVAWLYLAFGVFALLYGWKLWSERKIVRAWPVVAGTMLEAKVDVSPNGRAGKTGPPAFQYEALVKYSYQVAGVEYINDKLFRLGWIANTRKNRQRCLDELPDPPQVRYNPADPQDSCLLAHSVGMALWGLVLGTLVTLSASFYLAVTYLAR